MGPPKVVSKTTPNKTHKNPVTPFSDLTNKKNMKTNSESVTTRSKAIYLARPRRSKSATKTSQNKDCSCCLNSTVKSKKEHKSEEKIYKSPSKKIPRKSNGAKQVRSSPLNTKKKTAITKAKQIKTASPIKGTVKSTKKAQGHTKLKNGVPSKQAKPKVPKKTPEKIVKNKIEKPTMELVVTLEKIDKNHLPMKINNKKQQNEVLSEKNEDDDKIQINTVSKTPEKQLRKRVIKNYAEITLDTTALKNTQVDLNPSPHVPVYKKNTNDTTVDNKKEDLYEFDEFSLDEEKNPIKGKKRRKQGNRPSMFDKETHEILHKIEQKEKRQVKRTRKVQKKKPNNPSQPYEETIKNIVKNVIGKIKSHKDIEKPQVIKSDNCKQIPETRDVKITEFHKNGTKSVVAPTISVPIGLSESFDEIEVIPMNNFDSNEDIAPQSPENDTNNDLLESSEENGQVENFFGFDDCEDAAPLSPVNSNKTNSRINIISDIVLNTSDIDSPTAFNYKRPNANSTMLQISRKPNANSTMLVKRKSESPWRFGANYIRRNPLYLITKRTAMPCLDQDMVLDHTLVEKFEKKSSEKPTTSTKKQPVQQSILNYIESNVEVLETDEKIHQSSLFDYEEFNSPVKNSNLITRSGKTSQRKVLASINENILNVRETRTIPVSSNENTIENNYETTELQFDLLNSISPRKSPNNKVQSVKRKILTTNNENVNPKERSIESPTKSPIIENKADKSHTPEVLIKKQLVVRLDANIVSISTSPDSKGDNKNLEQTYFGFDNSGVETVHTDTENIEARPFRFGDSVTKRYPAKKKVVRNVVMMEKEITNESVDDITIPDENTDDDVHLFEDPEEILDNMPSEIGDKRRRRKRLCSTDSTGEERPRKKKKDIRTKSEEEAFEKWAAAFNSMCEEVEKYPLEIE